MRGDSEIRGMIGSVGAGGVQGSGRDPGGGRC